jgi:ankyrin repeat protein
VGNRAPFPNTLSLLYTAILSRNLGYLQLLLDGKAQADINIQYAFGRTPLHTTVEVGLLASIMQFLDYGTRTNIQDFSGAAPIHLAVLKKKNY